MAEYPFRGSVPRDLALKTYIDDLVAEGSPEGALDLNATADVILFRGHAFPGGGQDLVLLTNGSSQDSFRVAENGDIHTLGGLVMLSPDNTPYRLVVADDGTLSTEVL